MKTIPRYTIRPAEAADAPELARLAGELGYPCTPAVMAQRLAAARQRTDGVTLVAAGGIGLWGWVTVQRKAGLLSDPCAEITGLVVDGQARECGIGRVLVERAEDWAREHGLARMLVRTNVNRSATHRFYEHLGYLRSKSHHLYDKALPATLQA